MRKIIMSLMSLICIGQLYGQCKLETERITVFKDATVFVEKGGRCNVENNTLQIEMPNKKKIETPSSQRIYNHKNEYVKDHIILGTLDVSCQDNEVLSTESVGVENSEYLNSMHQILDNNRGKRIRIKIKESDKVVEGVIFSLENTLSLSQGNGKSKSLILKNDETWIFIDFAEIAEMEFIDEPLLNRVSSINNNLLVRLAENKENQKVKLSYLRKGITWTPNYFIEIKEDNSLDLSLRANVLNDVEELSEIDLNLAVGIPVFKYSTISEPLTSNQRVIQLISSLNGIGERPKSPMTNVLTSQRSSMYIESYGNNVQPVFEGQGKDDIFLYQLKGVSIKKGERVNLEVAKMESKYEDLYVVDLASNEYILSSQNRNKKEQETTNVWHSLKFDNNTGMPLTTGSVFFKKQINGGSFTMPVSQGELNFTPVGKYSIVKMSISPNIIIKDSDREISRERKADYNNRYAILVDAEIEVNNFKDEEVEMMINREIRGRMIEDLNEEWHIVRTARYLYDFNQVNYVNWTFKLGPNEKKVIKYRYEVQMR